jgi:hypothetical protein
MMGQLVYILCAVTSLGCAVLLWRGYRRSRLRLLFWSALCFGILAISNGILILDMVVFPDVYILPIRSAVTQVALLVLLFGLIFESD